MNTQNTNIFCTMIKESYVKKEGTKTIWQLEKTKSTDIDETHYINIIGAIPFFKNLGGTETLIKEYTSKGYKATKLTSTSPDKKRRSIYKFIF